MVPDRTAEIRAWSAGLASWPEGMDDGANHASSLYLSVPLRRDITAEYVAGNANVQGSHCEVLSRDVVVILGLMFNHWRVSSWDGVI